MSANGKRIESQVIAPRRQCLHDDEDLVPEHFLHLSEVAGLAGRGTNALRKHFTQGWEAQGLAVKDDRGRWWCDPSVVSLAKERKRHAPPDEGEDEDVSVAGVEQATSTTPRPNCSANGDMGGTATGPDVQTDGAVARAVGRGVRGHVPPLNRGGQKFLLKPRRAVMTPEDARKFIRAEQRVQEAISQLLRIPLGKPWELIETLSAVAQACRDEAERGGNSGAAFSPQVGAGGDVLKMHAVG